MMTEKLYYQDAYIREFTGTVQEVVFDEERILICLNRTAFYPEGGGQGADHGILTLPDGRTLKVTDVQETDGRIWHIADRKEGPSACGLDTVCVDAASERELSPGVLIAGKIDWERRFDHMQQHSGEHIVSGMICARFHCDNVGFHLGEDVVTIDFNHRITVAEAEEIEEQANRYIWEDHPFEVLWPTPEELRSLEYRSKKELEGDVRIARFVGADTCACCGTHVSGSAQVGLVKFLSAKNFHEGTRLELLCGARAVRFLSMNYRVNKAAAVMLSTSEENTAEYVSKLIGESIALKAALTEAQSRLLSMWAETFRGKGNICIVDDTLNPSQARPFADLAADCCGSRAAVFVKDGAGYRYAVIHKGADITELIRQMNQSLQGRGGGRNGFAQGSVNAGKEEIEEFFASLRS